MNLDQAAKYLAEKYNPAPYAYQVRYWKSDWFLPIYVVISPILLLNRKWIPGLKIPRNDNG